jgi:hypothetical protein
MSQLNCFGKSDFTCDKCGGEFRQTTAYSVARDWEEFEESYTYCKKCVEEEETEYSKLDGRSMNKTGRTYQLGTRVRKEFLEKLKRIAYEEKLKLVEVLEKALECYDERR